MADQKPDNNPNDPEIAKLRSAVLKWIEEKKEILQVKPAKPKPTVLVLKEPVKTVKIPPILPAAKKPIKSDLPPKPLLSPRKEPSKPVKKPNLPVKPPLPPLKKLLPKPISTAPVPARKLLPAKTASQPAPTKKNQPPVKSKGKLKKIFFITVLSAGLIFITFSLGLYFFTWQNQAVALIVKIIPYPAAFVNGRPIYYCQWQKEVRAVHNFYLKQKALNPNLTFPNLKQTKNSVLQRMIDEKIIDQAAEKYQVAVSVKEIEAQTQKLIGEIGGQAALEKQIRELYGWNLTDFQNEIIKPILLKNKLNLALIADGEYNKPVQETIQMIFGEIKNGQKSFAELAKQYSQDITGVQGGDLGYFGRGEMLLEIENAAFNLDIGQTSEIIKTRLGYHLIKLEEKLTDENGNLAKVRASQILIRGKNLDNLIKDLKAKIKIWQLVRV